MQARSVSILPGTTLAFFFWGENPIFSARPAGERVDALAPPGETMPLDASDQSLLAEALDEVPELSPSDRTRFGNALGRLLPPCF